MLPFACSSFGRFAPSTASDPLNNCVFPTCLLEPSPHAYTGDGFHKRQFMVYIRQTLFKDGQSELVQSILYQKELTEIIICSVKHYRLLTSKSNSENF